MHDENNLKSLTSFLQFDDCLVSIVLIRVLDSMNQSIKNVFMFTTHIIHVIDK